VFKRLVAKADVVVENFQPDVKARLGTDYESLHQINPGIVYGSMSGFGQDDLYHSAPASIRSPRALMSITRTPGEGPMRVNIPAADLTAGCSARWACRRRCCKRRYSC
jgi:formyl-CoA transferase